MAKARKGWVSTSKPKTALSGTLKDEVETKANDLIENVLKPKHVQPPPNDASFNDIIDLKTAWRGSTFYFISIYCCPGPNAVVPTFETKFARMDYVGNERFALFFMRHTGQWVPLYAALSVDECMKAIENDPWFAP